MYYTIKTTDKLKAGDIVANGGALFRLLEVSTRPDKYGTVYRWTTEVVDDQFWIGPKHWLKDWAIQGNKAASWRVENELETKG